MENRIFRRVWAAFFLTFLAVVIIGILCLIFSTILSTRSLSNNAATAEGHYNIVVTTDTYRNFVKTNTGYQVIVTFTAENGKSYTTRADVANPPTKAGTITIYYDLTNPKNNSSHVPSREDYDNLLGLSLFGFGVCALLGYLFIWYFKRIAMLTKKA